MFSLLSRPLGPVERYVIRKNDGSELEILSGLGARLYGWRTCAGNGEIKELLCGAADTSGSRLSPFPGRTRDAEWEWNGIKYKLENNVTWAKHALHGFLFVKPWHFESFKTDGDSARAKFSRLWYGEHPGYPFPFRATSTFEFTGNSFTVTSETENCGMKTLPYAEGWHPYFTLGTRVNNLRLAVPPSRRSALDDADIPAGTYADDVRYAQNNGCTIGDAFINDCFMFNNTAARAETILSDDSRKSSITKSSITVWQEAQRNQWPCVQIYTPPDRESIAIEPMTAEPDVLNHHRGLIEIPPGGKLSLRWGAEFRS